MDITEQPNILLDQNNVGNIPSSDFQFQNHAHTGNDSQKLNPKKSLHPAIPVRAASKKLTATATSFSVTFDSYEILEVTLAIPLPLTTSGGSDIATVQFNDDVSANYAYRAVSANSLGGEASPKTSIELNSLASGTNAEVWSFNIMNQKIGYKLLTGHGAQAQTASSLIDRVLLTGLWSNVTSQINKITINTVLGSTFPIGSSIYVYGMNP